MGEIIICTSAKWTEPFPGPQVASSYDRGFADAARKLLAKYPEPTIWGVAFRARGDGVLNLALDGDVSWLPDEHQAIPELQEAEFQVVLMNASQLKIAVLFTNRENIAMLEMGRWYSAQLSGEAGDSRDYKIEERYEGKLQRTFKGRVKASQTASAKPSDVRKIEAWCKLNRDKLPQDGELVGIDLNEVAID